ncbi:NAD(P)H-binding protein [Rathayibacter sp. YIM 133350]|uniref:NAD(P)-dependent oxidoreductase n=1 Tax=Rathayibacter sp. YIM 133350 TaxID=3131992 RepID=UPI00307E5545
MRIVVFGANGPTGRLVVDQAAAAGHVVTAVTRHPDGFPTSGVRVLGGDVLDPAFAMRAIEGQDAVLSVLGVPFGRRPVTVYSTGIANILAGMRAHGVRRLACVSSSATDPSAGAHGGFFFERVLQPIIVNTIGRTVYADMRRMEALVRTTDLDWTIVRPSGLFDAPAVSDYRIGENHVAGKFTARADLAAVLVRQVDDDAYVRRILAVSTAEGEPSLGETIMREAFGRRASVSHAG